MPYSIQFWTKLFWVMPYCEIVLRHSCNTGLTADQVVASLGLSIPAPDTLFTYNAIGLAANGSAPALSFMQVNSAVNNLVTSGANALSNDTSVYASFAIIVNQALAQKVCIDLPSLRRPHLSEIPLIFVEDKGSNLTCCLHLIFRKLAFVLSQIWRR